MLSRFSPFLLAVLLWASTAEAQSIMDACRQKASEIRPGLTRDEVARSVSRDGGVQGISKGERYYFRNFNFQDERALLHFAKSISISGRLAYPTRFTMTRINLQIGCFRREGDVTTGGLKSGESSPSVSGVMKSPPNSFSLAVQPMR